MRQLAIPEKPRNERPSGGGANPEKGCRRGRRRALREASVSEPTERHRRSAFRGAGRKSRQGDSQGRRQREERCLRGSGEASSASRPVRGKVTRRPLHLAAWGPRVKFTKAFSGEPGETPGPAGGEEVGTSHRARQAGVLNVSGL